MRSVGRALPVRRLGVRGARGLVDRHPYSGTSCRQVKRRCSIRPGATQGRNAIATAINVLAFQPGNATVSIAETLNATRAGIDAYERVSDTRYYFSTDQHAEFNGTVAAPGDVVLNEGGAYSLALDASAAGLADGVDVDAVSVAGNDDLIISTGDNPGFPLEISTPGSYILTSNLQVSGGNTTGVAISASGVTLGLNGFTLQGSTTCSGNPVTGCSDTGSGIGIDARGGNVIRNGSVVGFRQYGIDAGSANRLQNLRVEQNGEHGIRHGALQRPAGECRRHGRRHWPEGQSPWCPHPLLGRQPGGHRRAVRRDPGAGGRLHHHRDRLAVRGH